ncbi:MAG TPA: hypothetical protein PLO63_05720 [Syntrophales bacterium]|nr:hypothetical protein [Syntrophales bacterium]
MNNNINSMTMRIEQQINDVVHEIFNEYGNILLESNTEYLIESVWGVGIRKDLNEVQNSIHEKIIPVIDDVFNILMIKEISQAQILSIYYLVRSLITSRLMHMIDLLRLAVKKDTKQQDIIKMLMDAEAIGHA